MIRRRHHQKPLRPVPKWEGPKPTLRTVRIPVCRVHFEDLQEYLLKVFKMDIDIMQVLGLTHGMFPEYTVTGQMPQASNARQQADNVRRGMRCRNLSLILNVLCCDGFIPAGRYILDTTAGVSLIDQYRELVQRTEDPLHTECVKFKSKHRKDRVFMEQAVLMDKAVIKFNKDNAS